MGPPGLVWSNETLNGLYEREDVEMERWKEKQTDGTQRIKIEIKYKIKVAFMFEYLVHFRKSFNLRKNKYVLMTKYLLPGKSGFDSFD